MKLAWYTAILPNYALPKVVRPAQLYLTSYQQVNSTSPLAGLINFRQTAIGTACLLLGVLVYVTARPEGVLFLPEAFNLGHHFPTLLTSLTGSLPVFFHVVGLSLMTTAVLAPSKQVTVVICLGWVAINGLFELGQHATIFTWLSAWLPTGFQDIWLFEQTLRYFQNGTFDPADLAAILLAAAIAYPIIRYTTQLRGERS